ncbi:cytochrome P450 family protein [Kitasatospora cathayae]|uniref:Cytochrome P450 n=1 Tax=Kitasatospora cathayae TaxID=3004092 RepID=A0ABY7QBN4_9ACTN|nr:cytochrome P450 [Kitasatospora sp. HUAS 3-15]WBP90022.1 cytochrome P450 [Kitasatospora sp. HUAS 3-15]
MTSGPTPADSPAATAPETVFGPTFLQNPYPAYDVLRTEAPVGRHVVKTLASEVNAWVVTRHEDVRALLADPSLSKDALGLPRIVERHALHPDGSAGSNPRSMLFSDPPDHTRLRRIVSKAFTMRRVERMRPWIEQLADDLVDEIVPGAEFDLMEQIALAFPIYVIGALLGVPAADFADLRRWNGVLTSVEAGAAEKREAIGLSYAHLESVVAAKRRAPADDLVSALIEAEEDGDRLDGGELISSLFLLMNAGYETTANLIGSGVLALIQHPDQQRRLREDPALLSGAVEELLRYESPLNLATIRYTTRPVQVGEVVIPADEIVFVSLCAANRDPAVFDRPHALDVGRKKNQHLSFGHGIHHCIGAPLARLEGEVLFGRLLGRFRHWELAVPAEHLVWRHSLQFRGLASLPVRMS